MIDALAPGTAALLAELLVALHLAVVAFVVLGLAAVLVGGWRGWAWVRGRRWRLVHLLLVVVIALQAWLGRLCPLTILELWLRARAGQARAQESFVGRLLRELLYVDAPWWAFVAAYTLFLGAVALAWWRVPPRR